MKHPLYLIFICLTSVNSTYFEIKMNTIRHPELEHSQSTSNSQVSGSQKSDSKKNSSHSSKEKSHKADPSKSSEGESQKSNESTEITSQLIVPEMNQKHSAIDLKVRVKKGKNLVPVIFEDQFGRQSDVHFFHMHSDEEDDISIKDIDADSLLIVDDDPGFNSEDINLSFESSRKNLLVLNTLNVIDSRQILKNKNRFFEYKGLKKGQEGADQKLKKYNTISGMDIVYFGRKFVKIDPSEEDQNQSENQSLKTEWKNPEQTWTDLANKPWIQPFKSDSPQKIEWINEHNDKLNKRQELIHHEIHDKVIDDLVHIKENDNFFLKIKVNDQKSEESASEETEEIRDDDHYDFFLVPNEKELEDDQTPKHKYLIRVQKGDQVEEIPMIHTNIPSYVFFYDNNPGKDAVMFVIFYYTEESLENPDKLSILLSSSPVLVHVYLKSNPEYNLSMLDSSSVEMTRLNYDKYILDKKDEELRNSRLIKSASLDQFTEIEDIGLSPMPLQIKKEIDGFGPIENQVISNETDKRMILMIKVTGKEVESQEEERRLLMV